MVVVVTEVDFGPDHSHVQLVVDPALAEAGVEDGGLVSEKQSCEIFKAVFFMFTSMNRSFNGSFIPIYHATHTT